MKLTERQKRFADEYIISGNTYQSAIKAGYSDTYARTHVGKLLENVRVKSYLDERLEKIGNEKIATAEEVLKHLTAVMRGESQSEVVVVEGEGMGFSKAKKISKAPDEKERLKAAELLGKRFGIFSERTTLEIETPVVISGGDTLED